MNDSESMPRFALQTDGGHRTRSLGCLVVVVVLFNACFPTSKGTPAADANPSPATSDQAAARRQIDAAAAGIWEAVGRGDSAAILAHYADDAIILGSGGPMLQGKPAVAGFLQGLFAGNTFKDVKGNVTDIMISGNLAVETGHYAMTVIPKNGSAVADQGKYIHVWKQSPDGSWKVVRYMANSDVAPR
jgi:uncharacterized protein (TIGR02246 family)